jgi:hypothetical protein
LGDAPGDCQAEADACVLGAYAFGAAEKHIQRFERAFMTKLRHG